MIVIINISEFNSNCILKYDSWINLGFKKMIYKNGKIVEKKVLKVN